MERPRDKFAGLRMAAWAVLVSGIVRVVTGHLDWLGAALVALGLGLHLEAFVLARKRK
jgi:hypothetical protein